jgi:hypothetical protein
MGSQASSTSPPSKQHSYLSASFRCSSDDPIRTDRLLAANPDLALDEIHAQKPSGRNNQMHPKQLAATLLGMLVLLKNPRIHDERGLSQSAETAIIVAGAVAIATVIVALITAFVQAKLAKI